MNNAIIYYSCLCIILDVVTGCEGWGSCGGDDLKYRTCHTVDYIADDNGNNYQEIRR